MQCFAIEPEGSQVIAGKPVTVPRHKLQGAGYAAVPPQWDAALCDGTLGIGDDEAPATARLLARARAFSPGSDRREVAAALRLARDAPAGSIIATVACDTGLKYLSTDLIPD